MASFTQLLQYVLVACSLAMAAPTVYLAGDSTMAASGNGDGTQGWGPHLSEFISLKVVNNAVAGRSARSYQREGRFNAIAGQLKKGDFVVVEFGHNDGGNLKRKDDGRSDCNPVNNDYSTKCQTRYNGVTETVLTYEAYLVNAVRLFHSKGANVIISSATPDNFWSNGHFMYSANRFSQYARDAAASAGATFIDHGAYTAQLFQKAGPKVVDAYYPLGHVHTSPAGARVVAEAFVLAVEAAGGPLKQYITRSA